MRDGGGLLLACVVTETKKRVGDISSSNSREFTINMKQIGIDIMSKFSTFSHFEKSKMLVQRI